MKDRLRKTEWLEIISVRAPGSREIEHALGLCRQVASDRAWSPAVELALYRSAAYPTDLSVHIHWQAGEQKPAKSVFGIQMARALSDFGIINHTLWLFQRQETGNDAV